MGWDAMKLHRDIIEKIYTHALEEYPYECCGIVTGLVDRQTVHVCRNIQNQLHAQDPVRYPRDARTAYFIERAEFNGIVASAGARGEKVIALYHSHPEHDAYFSEDDLAAQTVFGEPEFPDALHVVVSVMNSKIQDITCLKWDRGMQEFVTVEEFIL